MSLKRSSTANLPDDSAITLNHRFLDDVERGGTVILLSDDGGQLLPTRSQHRQSWGNQRASQYWAGLFAEGD
jgi:hypothetical protein